MSEKLCNLCGYSLRVDEDPAENSYYGLEDIVATGHYLSPVLIDTMKYRFSLCEYCVDWLLSQLKIPPETRCYLPEETKWNKNVPFDSGVQRAMRGVDLGCALDSLFSNDNILNEMHKRSQSRLETNNNRKKSKN